MSDLHQRLDSLFQRGLIRKGLKADSPGPAPKRAGSGSLDTALEGQEVGEGSEKCLLFSRVYPCDYVFGMNTAVGDLIAGPDSLHEINFVGGKPLARREGLLFLDTETTGLAMGTGTYAFLIGVGYFQDQEFRVDQYFMRDFTEEEVLLTVLEDAISPFEQIVTYNGRTFDLQLLRNRYLMSGMLSPFDGKSDLDLLYLTRRFFRGRTENCRLTTIEREILGFRREGDVDGALIPELYFHYLRTGEFPELDLVLLHNSWDVLSMGYLTHLISHSIHDPIVSTEMHKGSFLRIGSYLEEVGLSTGETVDRCFEEAMNTGLGGTDGYDAARRMSIRSKRKGDYESACMIWRKMAVEDKCGDLFPLVELAKYYEHREKDYRAALEFVNDAMTRLDKWRYSIPPYAASRQSDELLRRLSRLQRRLEKNSG